jgi:hypothetical protein
MHEIGRGEAATSKELPPVSRDTCVRVAFAAEREVAVSLVSKDGVVLERVPETSDGALGSRGPVCFRVGAAPRLQFDSDAGVVRFVVWAAP